METPGSTVEAHMEWSDGWTCLCMRKESICTHFGVRPISSPCERSKVPETST